MSKTKDILDIMQEQLNFYNSTVCPGIAFLHEVYEIGVPAHNSSNLLFSRYRNRVNKKDLLEYVEGHSE